MSNAYDVEDDQDPGGERGYTPDDQSNTPGPGDIPERPDSQNSLEKNGPVGVPGPYPPPLPPYMPPPVAPPATARPPVPPPVAPPATARPPVPPPAAPPVARPPNLGPPQGQPPPPWPPTFRPNRRQWYFSPPARGPGMWGTPRRFPMLPPLWQIPMLFAQTGMGLGQFGSGFVSPLGFGLNRYTLAFMNGMQKGQLQYTKQMREQMDLQADLADQQLQVELDDYNRAFREFGDPNEDISTIKPENVPKLKQRLYEVARKYGDQNMKNALDNNDIKGAVDQIKYLDQKHGDLKAGRASRKTAAAEKAEEKAAPWGGEKKEDAAPTRWPRSEAEEKSMTAPRAAAAGAPPTPAAAGRLTDPAEEALARAEARGEHWTGADMDPGAKNRVLHRAGMIRAGIDDAIDNNSDRESKLAALQKVDPALADEVEGALDYKERVGYGREGMPPRIAQLAHRVDRNWNQGVYQFITEFRNPNGATGKTMFRSSAMASAAEEVLKAAQVLVDKGYKLDEKGPAQYLEEWLDKKIEANPEWSNFYSAYNSYIQEMVAVTRGGTGAEGDIIRGLRIAPIHNIRQVLGAIRTDANVANGRLEGNKFDWDQQTRGVQGPAPGFNPHAGEIFRGLKTLDENRFKFGKDAPEELRALEPKTGVGPPEVQQRRRERADEPDAGAKVPPEHKAAYDWARAHPNDPKAQEILKRLGF
jgi:hypothetical protein